MNADSGFGTNPQRIRCIDANNLFDFLDHSFRVRLRQIDLIQYRQHLQSLLNGSITIGHRLSFDALGGINHQQSPFTGCQ